MEKNGKEKELRDIRKINTMANLEFIIQKEQKGLGHAILCAEDYVGDDSFAVLLGDTICLGSPNCTKALVDLFNDRKANVFSVEEIKVEETDRYGVISGTVVEENLMLVNNLVEKPGPKKAPSLLGIQGRYVFTSELFNHLKSTGDGKDGQIQLTDAMNSLSKVQQVYSWKFGGKRYDIGTMRDWFQSHLELSAGSDFANILKEALEKL